MLIKASTVIGLRVFTIKEGKKIDTVEDVIYHPKLNKIEALLVDPGGWFSEAKVIIFEDIRKIGKNAVLIDTAEILKKVSDAERDIEYIVKSDRYLAGAKIITEDGVALGRVTDIYFDNDTGIVEEFEVSQEEQQHAVAIRVKIADIITIGEDATIVRVSEEVNAIESVREREKVQESIVSLRHQTPKILADVQEQIRNASEKIKKQSNVLAHQIKGETPQKATTAKERMIERRKKDAVGLYLSKNILKPDDRMLAKEGDMVTYKLLQEAEDADVLEQVLNNVVQRMSLMT